MKTPIFHKLKYDLKGHTKSLLLCLKINFFAFIFFYYFSSRSQKVTFLIFSSTLITILTYVLMDNFCPCFIIFVGDDFYKKNQRKD